MSTRALFAFANWSQTVPREVVVPMLSAIGRASRLPENERAVYVKATADMLDVDNLPELGLDEATRVKKRRRILVEESEDEDNNSDIDDDDNEETGVEPGKYYMIETEAPGGGTETSYFWADTPTDATWLYTYDQLKEVFDEDELPERGSGNELFMSDHTQTLTGDNEVRVVDIERGRHRQGREKPFIAGVCKTTAPRCVLAFPDSRQKVADAERVRRQADDYITVLLSRGSNGCRELERLVRATKEFVGNTPRSTRCATCSACGMKREITKTVVLGGDCPKVYRMGSYCYKRVRLAWQMATADSSRELERLCDVFRDEIV